MNATPAPPPPPLPPYTLLRRRPTAALRTWRSPVHLPRSLALLAVDRRPDRAHTHTTHTHTSHTQAEPEEVLADYEDVEEEDKGAGADAGAHAAAK